MGYRWLIVEFVLHGALVVVLHTMHLSLLVELTLHLDLVMVLYWLQHRV